MIFPKIKKFFKNSKYYQNYQNIDSVLDIYGNIKKKHTDYENQIKIELIEFIHEFIKCGVEESYLEEYISYLFEEFDFDFVYDIISKFDETTLNIINNLNSIKLLLDKDINDKNFILKNSTPEYYLKNQNLTELELNENKIMKKFFNKCFPYKMIVNQKLIACDEDIGKYIKFMPEYDNDSIDKGLKEHVNCDYTIYYCMKYCKDNVKTIKNLIKKGLDINDKYILECCVKYENKEILKFLYEKGCDIHYDDDYLFIRSLYGRNVDLVEFFVERNADVFAQNFKAIEFIISGGYLSYLKIFVKHGVDIHFNNEYILRSCIDIPKLYQNTMSYSLKIIKFLIEKNSDIHCLDDLPLRLACSHGHFDIVKLLVENKANIHCLDDLPLRLACTYGYFDIAKLLIENKANIHCLDDQPLRSACSHGYFGIVELLVENGANVPACEYEAIKNVVDNKKRKDILKYLLENCKNTKDGYPLLVACKHGYLEIVKSMFERGFDIHYNDDICLKQARQCGYIDIVDFLINNGCKN